MILLIFFVTLIGILLYYVIDQQNYFKKRNIIFVKPTPILGSSWKPMFRQADFFNFYKQMYENYPDEKIVGYFEGLQPTLLVRDPELIKQITVKHFDNFINRRLTISPDADPFTSNFMFVAKDDHWRAGRNALSPSFTGSKMRFLFTILNSYAKDVTQYIEDEKLHHGTYRVNAYDFFRRCTSDIIANAALGFEAKAYKDENDSCYLLTKKLIDLSGWFFFRFILFAVAPSVAKFFKVQLLDSDATKQFSKIITEAIEHRKQNNIRRPDMIQMAIDSDMSIDVTVSQAAQFVAAGFDTTATFFQFVAYSLALHPEIQEKLQEEIDVTIGNLKEEGLTYEALQSMKYMDAVFQESLRMHPPVLWLERACKVDTILEDSDGDEHIIKAGEHILISPSGLHYDKKYFDEPKKFNPDRFVDSNTIDSGAYIPFGVGPRQCIGTRLALMNGKLIFTHLLSKFTLEPNTDTPIPIEFENGMLTLAVKKGDLSLDFKLREKY